MGAGSSFAYISNIMDIHLSPSLAAVHKYATLKDYQESKISEIAMNSTED